MEENLNQTIERYKSDNNQFIIYEAVKVLRETSEDDIKLKALGLLSQVGQQG